MDITFRSGDTVTVTVTQTVPFGALVETADGVPGLIRETGLSHGTALARGTQLDVRVIDVDTAEGRFSAERA